LLSDVFTASPAAAATRFGFGNGSAIYLAFGDSGGPSLLQRVRGMLAAAGVKSASSGAGDASLARHVREVDAAAGVKPPFPIVRTDGTFAADIETHIFDNGPVAILAVQRDLLSPDFAGDPTGREAIAVNLPREFEVYNLRPQRGRGETDRIALDLGPGEAAIFALSPKPLAAPAIGGPAQARLGENAQFRIRADPSEAPGVIHVDIVDPTGWTVRHYSGNILTEHGEAVKLLPLACNDQTGIWKIRATDALSGQTATAQLAVAP
jgi:hypothetical protein